ncbi:hypothetical protein D3C77_648800 [compost metagenome]
MQIGPDVAIGVTEELYVDRVVAQQIDNHLILARRVVQAQYFALVIEHGFFQALALGIKADHYLADRSPLAQRLALEAQGQR